MSLSRKGLFTLTDSSDPEVGLGAGVVTTFFVPKNYDGKITDLVGADVTLSEHRMYFLPNWLTSKSV